MIYSYVYFRIPRKISGYRVIFIEINITVYPDIFSGYSEINIRTPEKFHDIQLYLFQNISEKYHGIYTVVFVSEYSGKKKHDILSSLFQKCFFMSNKNIGKFI